MDEHELNRLNMNAEYQLESERLFREHLENSGMTSIEKRLTILKREVDKLRKMQTKHRFKP